jgi:hypothetical protein
MPDIKQNIFDLFTIVIYKRKLIITLATGAKDVEQIFNCNCLSVICEYCGDLALDNIVIRKLTLLQS